MKESCSFELAHLKKKKEKKRKKENILAASGSALHFVPVGMLFVTKTLEDEQYVVIKAYKFTVFERFIYCVSTLSQHTESTNSII